MSNPSEVLAAFNSAEGDSTAPTRRASLDAKQELEQEQAVVGSASSSAPELVVAEASASASASATEPPEQDLSESANNSSASLVVEANTPGPGPRVDSRSHLAVHVGTTNLPSVQDVVEKFRAMSSTISGNGNPSSSSPATSTSTPTSPTFQSKASAAVSSGSVTLSLNYAPGIALIRLNNVMKRNAISAPMIAQFHDAITALETMISEPSSPLVAVILTGVGRSFCAGFDLDLAEMISGGSSASGEGPQAEAAIKEKAKMSGYEMSLAMGDALRRLRKLELISLAVVDGYAVGGGAEIASACDFRLLTDQAFVRFVQVKIGLTTAWGGATYLSKLVTPRVALRLLTTTGRIEVDAAERIGFADRVVSVNPNESDDEVLAHALKFLAPMVWSDPFATKKVPHPAIAIRKMKKVIHDGYADDEERELERERTEFIQLWGGKEMREAIAARQKHG